jgi:hypothetical protein
VFTRRVKHPHCQHCIHDLLPHHFAVCRTDGQKTRATEFRLEKKKRALSPPAVALPVVMPLRVAKRWCHYVWPSGGAITRGQRVVPLRVAKRWCHYARPSSGSSMSSYPNMLGEGRFGVLKVTHWIFSITRAQPFYRHKLCGIRINNLFAVVCPFVCSSWVYDLFTAVVCIPLSAWCAVFILYAYISVS